MQSDEEVSNNAIVLHVTNEDKTSSTKQMSVKEEALGVNGKRRTWKSRASDVKNPSTLEIVRANSLKVTRPRSIGTPPMTPRRSLSSTDSNEKTLTVSVAAKKARSESVEGNEKTTPGRVKKTRSEICTTIVKAGEFDSVALRKVSSLPAPNSEKSDKKTEHVVNVPKEETINDGDHEEDSKIPEEVKEFGVCQEMIVSANSNEDERIDDGDHEEDDEEEKEEEVEKKSVDVKEMNVAKEKRVGGVEIKKLSQFQNRTSPSPSSVRKISPPVIKRAASVYSAPPNSTSSTDRFAEQEDNFTQSQSKLQSLVDLVMWRDVSRSTLVFGFGTFLIISSSYANDLNFSFISVVAYMGLIYLGLMFVLKSLIHRGMVEEERHKVVGVREEDVKRMLRLIMPYLNESLHQLRALFSGDPSTTLKMGVVLFVLARCGSSITLWNLAKFGNFWMRRFRDAWESCNHKKAVALALFTLVWNLSSVTARVWAAFMLLVAFRYYQHKMIWTTDQADDDDENVVDEEEEEEEKEQACVTQNKIILIRLLMGPKRALLHKLISFREITNRREVGSFTFPLSRLHTVAASPLFPLKTQNHDFEVLSPQANKFKMSVASDSPVHSSSSSDDLAAFLDAELDSASDASSGPSEEEEAEDDEESGLKRRKLEHLETVDEEEIEEASSSKGECQHPGSFGNMCFVCGQKLEETGVSFRYIHKEMRLNEDEISRLRDSDSRFLQRQRKLYLVLDLDHTLLNSTVLRDLKPEEEYLKSHTHSLQDVSGGSLFMLEFMHMMTKLRPFVHSFLKEASEMFVMYIYTMGDRAYARQMAKLLDPKGEYFGDRIISRDDGTVRHQKSLDVVLGQESAVLILDDTENAWPNHKDNLIVIERYHFFASSCTQFDHKYKSLSELKSDESEPDGALATVLKVLKQAHALFFENVDEDISNRDVRSMLKQVRKEVLKGCKVVFSRVFPTKAKPEDHPLWKMADELGATCVTEVDASVTHVVAMDVGTEKARWAVREKKYVVHRGWIDAANYLWKKQPEEKFSLEQLKKQQVAEEE
ncbi:unnamed protein product [Arabidopsis halleri]